MSEYETVEFDIDSLGVATITLDRPEKLNAFNQFMLNEFAKIWSICRERDEVRVIVLRANGERSFSTGVDQNEGRTRVENPWNDDYPGTFLGPKQNRATKPMLCARHGMVAGGAFYFINEADIIICADDTTFFDPHTSYGMTAAMEPIGLLRRMPIGDVMRIALLGLDERMSAQRALEIGLVSEVVTRDQLWERANTLAQRIAKKAPIAVQGTVKAIWESFDVSYAGSRRIPFLYTQVGNPLSRVPYGSADKPPFEIR